MTSPIQKVTHQNAVAVIGFIEENIMPTQNYGTVPSRNTSVASPPPRKRGLLEQPMEPPVKPIRPPTKPRRKVWTSR